MSDYKSQLTSQISNLDLNGMEGSLSKKSSSLTDMNTLLQPQSQSSFKRKHSVQRFNRSSFTSTTATPMSSSPKETFTGESPKIHSKLYCNDSLKATKDVFPRIASDNLKTELAETANGVRRVRMLAKHLSRATIQLDVKAVMIVTKAKDNSLIYLTREVVEWLFSKYDIAVYVDSKLENSKRFDKEKIIYNYPVASKQLKFWNKKSTMKSPELFDLVVTLGGDGTVLYVSNLFQKVVPPVLSFALGSLGFLTNFKFDEYKERMIHCIDSGVKANLRMRFTCRVHTNEGKLICEQQVLNELVVDRGPSPFVTSLELYGDGSLLTVVQADGLIIATPTGSTAYSLSAGGSLVHPGVSAISVTPICPHTLSFRPILLPDTMFLKIKVPSTSRSTAWCSFDGKIRTELKKGYYVTIQASPFPFPTVLSSKTEYIDSVSRNLHWNIREAQKPFSSYLQPEMRKIAMESDEHDFDITYTDEESETSEDTPYVPSNGGTHTPQSQYQEERCCFAHPHARVSY